jgi:hypothetical protein
VNAILCDRELRDLIDEILDANDELDAVMSGMMLEDHEHETIWRASNAMVAVVEYLLRLRDAHHASRGASS